MASQSFFDLECANRDVKLVAGRFDVGSAGAITTKFGLGWSAVKESGDGEYTITLDKSYTGLLHASTMHFDLGAGTDEFQIVVIAEDVANATTPTVKLQCVNTAGGAANIPDGDDFSFCLYLLDGEVS
jgi:hypothetical protein